MIDFKILHTHNFLDLDDEFSMSLTLINPVFDKESLERVFSYTISLPATPHNNQLFQHNYRLDASGNRNYSVEMHLLGNRFESGVLILQKSTPTKYTAIFRSALIDLAERLKRKNLRDLSLPESIPFSYAFDIDIAAVMAEGEPWVNDQEFIIEINQVVVSEKVADTALFLSKCNDIDNVIVTEITGQPISNFRIRIQAIDPTIPVYVNIFPEDPPEHPVYFTLPWTAGLQNLYTYQQMHIAWQTHLGDVNSGAASDPTHRFPVLKMTNAYNDKVTGFKGYANYRLPSGVYTVNTVLPEQKQWNSTLIPFTYLNVVLDKIAEGESFTFHGDLYEDDIMDDLLIGSNVTLDFSVYEHIDIVSSYGGWYNVWEHEYDLADHLPDISAFDLLQVFASGFGAWFRLKDARIHVNGIQSILGQNAIDWTDKISPKYVKGFSDDPDRVIDYDRQGDDEDYGDPLRKLTIDGTDTSPIYEYLIGFLVYKNYRGYDKRLAGQTDSRDWLVPETSDEVYSPPAGMTADTRIRFTKWVGNLGDSEGNPYPFSTYGISAYDGFLLTDSLAIEGSTGLYEKRLKRLIRLLAKGDTISIPAQLTITDILELRKWTNPRRHFYTANGSATGIVKSVKLKISRTGIESASVELIKE